MRTTRASILVATLARGALAFLGTLAAAPARISTSQRLPLAMQQGLAGADSDGMLWVFGCVE
jgi:hypothetical protein